jgi:hypothetical protein
MPKWAEGLPRMMDSLKSEKSVLRISYRRRVQEDNVLAEARVKALADAIREQWKRDGAPYTLPVETEIYADRSAQK